MMPSSLRVDLTINFPDFFYSGNCMKRGGGGGGERSRKDRITYFKTSLIKYTLYLRYKVDNTLICQNTIYYLRTSSVLVAEQNGFKF
jgi:hypothetical protein